MWQSAVERPGAAVVGASRLRQTVEAKGGLSTARYPLRRAFQTSKVEGKVAQVRPEIVEILGK